MREIMVRGYFDQKIVERGAVLHTDCENRGYHFNHAWKCACPGKCARCGFKKHTGIHGPLLGQPAGSKPWGHEYVEDDGTDDTDVATEPARRED